MHQTVGSIIHCINPDCPRPYPQTWGNKFCNSCGSTLQLRNRYVPLQRLGSGGFATLYTIWDLEAQAEKVLKVLVEASPKAQALFEQEAVVLASLRQPGVPFVESDGHFYVETRNLAIAHRPERQLPCLVMEKINGYTLEEILERHPQGCPEEWVISWLNQAVAILQELHSRQIIHRDIKPSNLMLRTQGGQLVLIDFGGAKQLGPAQSPAEVSSTRLFSSGYSPPEQIAGGAVGPAADFYALSRTMIQLLTGKYPPDLENPMTGEFRWRDAGATVSPAVANLLDDMAREDVRQRPTTAAAIERRLAKIRQQQRQPISKFLTQLAQATWNRLWVAIKAIAEFVGRTTLFLTRFVIHVVGACLDTIWGMVLGGIGACVGTATGFLLAYWSPLGELVAGFVSNELPRLVPEIQIGTGSEIILFAAAGLGTACGLTAAGGFKQRRRYLVAGLMGLLSYGLGWLVWQLVTPYAGVEGLAGLIVVAVSLLTLGLGLPSHHLVHAIVASAGTTTIFAGLVVLNFLPATLLFHFQPQPSWQELAVYIAFFGLVSIASGFFLGVSYYLVVPFLRFLGWR